jgi:glutamate-1-semialdehyde 2,1-aminomutase
MSHRATASELLYERARKVLPGGVSRNTIFRQPHPFYAHHGSGCFLTDLEGVERIDFSNNVASLIHGHAHPAIVESVTKQLHCGSAFGIGTEAEVLLAEHLCRRVPGFDKIRFVNSGSEAIMAAIKTARAVTGRSMIAKVEGAYHGGYDYAEVSQTPKPSNWGPAEQPTSVPLTFGTPQSVLGEVLVVPFNDVDRTEHLLDTHAENIACVLIDPLPHRVGFIPATPDYMRGIRDWTERHGALLVFDEIITFRSNYGGAQAAYAERPDLTAMGKMIGGGFPVGAFAGRDDVMRVLDPSQAPLRMPLSGTFSANAISMTAGRVAMELFDPQAVNRLNQLGDLARQQITEAIRIADIPACVTGIGSIFRVHLKPTPPTDYRSAYSDPQETQILGVLLDYLFDHGILVINTCSGMLSTPMTEREIDRLAEAMLGGFRKIRPMFA